MTGTIKVLYEGEIDMAEAMDGAIEPKLVKVTFDLTKVSSFYEVGEGDSRYLHTVVDGYDFLFVYEDILKAALENHLGENTVNISA